VLKFVVSDDLAKLGDYVKACVQNFHCETSKLSHAYYEYEKKSNERDEKHSSCPV
jgi:hypothetical protein